MSRPTTTPEAILLAFSETIRAAMKAGPDKVHVGDPDSVDVPKGWKAFVWPVTDAGHFHEGKRASTLIVTTALRRVDDEDRSLGQTEVIRLMATWARILRALARASNNGAGTAFAGTGVNIFEHDDGVTTDGFDKPSSTARIGCSWRVDYLMDITEPE